MTRLFKVSSFRAVLLYLALFLASAGLAGSFLYNQIDASITATGDNLVWRDAAMMSQSYQRGGVDGLRQAVQQQSQVNPDAVYLLADSLGQYLAGNLSAFPTPAQTSVAAEGWQVIEQPAGKVRARLLRLDDDVILLIGRDLTAQQAAMGQIRQAFFGALALLVVLGVLGGAVMARQSLARVEKINRSLRPIMAGDFSARIDSGGAQDELADLESQINAMLSRIEKLMAEMREVTDNLAHDLRSPLTRLRGRLDAMQADTTAPQAVADSLADIDQLLGVFSSILALSKLDSGLAEQTHQPVDVVALVDDVVELYEAAFDEAGWQVDYQAPRNGVPVMVEGDAPLLAQAMINLLENALAYGASDKAALRVSVAAQGEDVAISVADSGAGVPEAELAHIRQRFVRLDDARSAPGNGLGLSLVDAICRHHGGRLELSTCQPSGLQADIILAQRK